MADKKISGSVEITGTIGDGTNEVTIAEILSILQKSVRVEEDPAVSIVATDEEDANKCLYFNALNMYCGEDLISNKMIFERSMDLLESGEVFLTPVMTQMQATVRMTLAWIMIKTGNALGGIAPLLFPLLLTEDTFQVNHEFTFMEAFVGSYHVSIVTVDAQTDQYRIKIEVVGIE